MIGLRTVKGTKQLKLDPTIYDALQKERVQVRRQGEGADPGYLHAHAFLHRCLP